MLKIKNTKHLDTAEEIFTEFLDKFQKYAAEAAEISKGKDNLSPADKLKALECLETRYAALSNFFTGELGYEVRLEERRIIEAMYAEGAKPGEIAQRVGKCQATIYRELERGKTGKTDSRFRQGYSAEVAEARVNRSYRNRGRRKAAQ